MKYKIAEEYTDLPGGRYVAMGPHSGEDFRDSVLVKLINNCIKNNDKLILDFDGAYGYPPSFREEAFGGLVRKHNFSYDTLKNILNFISKDDKELPNEILNDIKKANEIKK
ncbi:MAG: STAS-like domain-containing protein [Fusobacteriaceae bacterium]